jgi:hypothetical protein
MISSKKTKHKRLRIDESSHARKSHKKTRKRHENHSSQEKKINPTMNASIQPDVRISKKHEENLAYGAGN